ncbi:MAG: glycosyltransferase family 4 protein [Kiritimatiellia bacterium]|jgi:glycosyltransferase involved in cell wall biosynthesis
MITVLQLCEHFGGREASLHGVARAFQWWLPAFDTRRFRVLLCSRKGPDKASAQMRAAGLDPLHLGFGKLDPRNLTALLRLLRRERVDIIHAHGYGACTWGRLAGLRLNLPVIVHERCNYGVVPWYQRPVERILGPHTKYALAVSESTKQFCIQQRYLPANTIEVLYHGMMMEDMPKADPVWLAALRAEHGAGADIKVIGIVGRLEPHKGHADAMSALAKLQRNDWQLWIVGDGSSLEDLRVQATALGIADRTVFLGFRPDARKVIQAFDIQLFPSRMEGTPNTLYEALAAGHAIAASTADGQGEILSDGTTALMFPPGDIPRMGEQLTRLLDDAVLRDRLRTQAAQRAKDFDGRRTIERLQSLYERIMAAPQPA